MNISPLQPADEALLQAFKDKEYPAVDKEHYGDNQPNFETKEFVLVAKDNDQIVGYLRLSIHLNIAYIESLLIAAESRGKGFGKQLVEEAEIKAKENGAHKIWLETGLNWSAKPFYEKLGYTIRTILPNDAGHQDCVLMDKML